MDATRSSGTSFDFQRTTLYFISDDKSLQTNMMLEITALYRIYEHRSVHVGFVVDKVALG
jgi:hypothetical protein